MLYNLIKPIIFKIEPELAHDLTLRFLASISYYKKKNKFLPIKLFNLDFPNPIGAAAGIDKNGEYIKALEKIGFGFIEVGTVTPKPQYGNPKPRVHRLIKEEAVINSLGFNNKGIIKLTENLKKSNYEGIVGVNIGKNYDTTIDRAHEDYEICLNQAYNYASYFTINISSPNTKDLRKLQNENNLDNFLFKISKKRDSLRKKYNKNVPILIKISPDLEQDNLEKISRSLIDYEMDGIIASNTTLSREKLLLKENFNGGLSGKPLKNKSFKILKQLNSIIKNKIPIISVGGISNFDDVDQRLMNGARLVQIYTGLIYSGPNLIFDIINQYRKRKYG